MNGWTNYETWSVVNWDAADVFGHPDVEDIMHDDTLFKSERVRMLADLMKNQFNDIYEELIPSKVRASVFGDLLFGAIQSVNWREIAESWYDDNAEEYQSVDTDDSDIFDVE